jgi:lysophospholipase L1-like esterase
MTGGAAGSGGSSATPTCDSNTGDTAESADAGSLKAPTWDWVGIIGTGQSLSVGTTPVTSTQQPYHNLKLSLGDVTVPPWDAGDDSMSLVPLVEPIRPVTTVYPSPYPGNIWGETPHSAMANEITFLVQCEAPDQDYVTVHTVVGESGQGITALQKETGDTTGDTGRAYAATIFEAQNITRLAAAAGKTYGIGAIIMTHGETDSGSSTYKNALIKLLADYNADLSAITGQTQPIPMYLSQQHGYPNGSESQGQRPVANIVQWQLGIDHKDEFVCVGPQYQYEANKNGDGIHLSALGYQMLGEKNAEVYYERAVLGRDWQPLQPTTVERSGRAVTVHFHVPVPPLNWDDAFDAPSIQEWVNGRGFELRTNSSKITIASVEISGDAVVVTAGTDLPASGLIVGYALSSQGVQMNQASKSVRWGQLRDSDPFVGTTSKQPNANYAVSFELPVP